MSGRAVAVPRLVCWSVLVFAGGVDAVLPADRPAEVADSLSDGGESSGPPERVIYIPFERFSDVFGQPDASVLLKRSDYLKLLERDRRQFPTGADPADAVITRSNYIATIEQDLARIQAELTVNVLGKPWVEVPVRFGDAAVGAVTGPSGGVLLRGTGDGTYSLLFQEQGEQQVTLELAARVVNSPDGRRIELACPPSAITTFELTIPQADQQIEIHPRGLPQPVEGGAEESRVRANLGATEHITASWRPLTTTRPQMQLMAAVTNRQRHHLADGLVHVDAWLTYDVLRGQLQQVRIVVPPGHRILDVSASNRLRGWQAEALDDRQVLTVDLLSPVDDEVTVEVHTEKKLEGSQLQVGGYDDASATGVHALDVVRESGQIVLSRGEELSVRVTEQSGVVRLDPDEVATEVRQPGGLAFQYYNPGFRLSASVTPVEPRITASHRAEVVIGDDEVGVVSDLTWTIERAGVFELRVSVPDSMVIDDVRSERLQEYRVSDGTLLMLLRERTLGEVRVTIEGHHRLDEASVELTLPILEPLDVERETGLVQLFADDAVDVTTNEQGLESARPAPIVTESPRGESRPRAAWRFTRRPVVIPVTVARKPARVSATVATDISVESSRTRVVTLIDFTVEYAGVDRFRILIPEEARETLQIEAVALASKAPLLKSQQGGEADDGWIPYTLVMQREVLGRQRFRVVYDIEPTEVVVPVAVDGDAPTAATADAGTDAAAETGGSAPVDFDVVPAGTDSPQPDAAVPDDGGDDSSSHGPAVDDTPDATVPSTPNSSEESVNDGSDPRAEEPGSGAASEASGGGAVADAAQEDAHSSPTAQHRGELHVRIIRPLDSFSGEGAEAATVSRVTGEIRVHKEHALTVTAESTGADVEPVDVRELVILPQNGTFAFRYRTHPPEETIAVHLMQAQYEVAQVTATVVSRALVEVVLGEDLTATYRCRYRLKSTERQRLRVELPKGLEVLSVLVNGSEERLEPDPSAAASDLWETYFVKVAREGASDEPFTVTFQFLWMVNPKPFDRGLQGTIRLPLPRIGEPTTSAVQQTRVVVWVPRDYALIGDPGGFTLLGRTSIVESLWVRPIPSAGVVEDEEWIAGGDAALVEFPTTGRVAYRYSNLGGDLELDPTITLWWWDLVWYTIVISVALGVIGWVLLRTSWENKLGVLLLLAFLGVLLGLKSEQTLAHVVWAARFGLAFLLGLWVVGAAFGRRGAGTSGARTGSHAGWRMTDAGPPHAAVVPPPGVFEQLRTRRRHEQSPQ